MLAIRVTGRDIRSRDHLNDPGPWLLPLSILQDVSIIGIILILKAPAAHGSWWVGAELGMASCLGLSEGRD